MLRVFLVSALPAVRAGLRALLVGSGAAVLVIGDAHALDPALLPGVDVIVLDTPPGMDAAEIAAMLENGEVPAPTSGWALVILGPVNGDARLPAYLAGHAWAYLPRDADAAALAAAVRAAGAGLVSMDPGLATSMLTHGGLPGAEATRAAPLPQAALAEALTSREREVLQLIALGLSNKLIARRLAISDHTVKFHVAAILSKLGAASRTEAVHLGTRLGVVSV